MISTPTAEDHAGEAFDRFAISWDAYRRARGFSEGDAPLDDEINRRVGLNLGQWRPVVVSATGSVAGAVAGVVSSAMTAAASQPLGHALAAVDRSLMARLLAGSSAAMGRALERAGNKLRQAAKPSAGSPLAAQLRTCPATDVVRVLGSDAVSALATEEELFGDAWSSYEGDYRAAVTAAQLAAIAVVGRYGQSIGRPWVDTLRARQASAVDASWWQLQAALSAKAHEQVLHPDAVVTAQGEVGLAGDIATGEVRAALARAGGASSTTETVNGWRRSQVDEDGFLRGVASGPDMMAEVDRLGWMLDGWEWDYGSAPRRNPDPEHQGLDGTVAADFGGLYPGDHAGCLCLPLIPVLVGPK